MTKNRYIFALITILLCGDYAFAADSSVITSVILYPGNATIERTVRVAARASRVELTGVPANFDPQSIRVEGDACIHVGNSRCMTLAAHRRSVVTRTKGH